MLLIIRLFPIWLILDIILASYEGTALPETCYRKGINFNHRNLYTHEFKRYNNITEVEGCFNKCKSDFECNDWSWNKKSRRCFTMNLYWDERKNKNFISGEKYCHDLPSICDCGVETAPETRAKEEALLKHFYKYKWVAKLQNEDSGMNCEGTLISSKYIVSAAHCTYNSHAKWKGFSPADTLKVILPYGDIDELSVADYFVHEGYNYKKTILDDYDSFIRPSLETSLQHDIVLLELEHPVNLEIYTPVCLPRNKQQFIGEKATAHFFSVVDYESYGDYGDLLKEDLPIVTPGLCERKMNLTLHPGQMCAGGEEDRDHCQENSNLTSSGGPLTVKTNSQHVLSGIASSSPRCGVGDGLALFSRISYYRDWIMKHMKNPKFCHSGPSAIRLTVKLI